MWTEISSFSLFALGIWSHQQKGNYDLTPALFLRSHGLGKENIQEPLSWPHTEKMTFRLTVSTLDKCTSTLGCYCQEREYQKHTEFISFWFFPGWKTCSFSKSELSTDHLHSSLIMNYAYQCTKHHYPQRDWKNCWNSQGMQTRGEGHNKAILSLLPKIFFLGNKMLSPYCGCD